MDCSVSSFSLNQLRRGQRGIVRQTHIAESDAALLGAMGLCCDAKVKLCRGGGGGPCIVSIATGKGASCRIGLARHLAEKIVVDLIPDSAS